MHALNFNQNSRRKHQYVRSRYDSQKKIAGEPFRRDSGVGADEYIRIENNPHACQPSFLPQSMWPNLAESFLKSSLHLFLGCFPMHLGRHVIQVCRKILGVPAVLALQRIRDDLGKVTLG